MGAALNVSPEAFLEYKTALYSTKYHPDETTDKFKDDSYLIKVANTVSALKNNTKFQTAVKNGTYDAWALDMSEDVRQQGGRDRHPELKMDGKRSPPTVQRAHDGGRLQHGGHGGPQGLSLRWSVCRTRPSGQPKSGRTFTSSPALVNTGQ
jgi:hypothetical protein